MKTEKDKRMLIREKGSMPFGQKFGQKSMGPTPTEHLPPSTYSRSQTALLLSPPVRRTHTKISLDQKKTKNTHTNTC